MLVRNRALEARLVEDPDDPLGYEVYGDWLCGEGSPHGELMQIQRARQLDPRHPAWRAREAELLDQHAEALIGPGLAWRARQLAWDTGYVRGLTTSFAHLCELLDHPAGLLVRDVCVRAIGSLQGAIDRLAAAPPVMTSLKLVLEPQDHGPGVADPRALCRAQPRLVRLELWGGAQVLDGLSAGVLRELAIAPRRLGRDHLRALRSASLPALEQLQLWFDFEDDADGPARLNRGGPAKADLPELAALLAALPASLCELRIFNADAGDALCEMICRSLAGRLRRLVLSDCDVTDAGAAVLRAHRDRFVHLDELDVNGHDITNPAALDSFPLRSPLGW